MHDSNVRSRYNKLINSARIILNRERSEVKLINEVISEMFANTLHIYIIICP